MSWAADNIRSPQTALKEGQYITTIPTVTFQQKIPCTQGFHNPEVAPSNLAAHSRCPFMSRWVIFWAQLRNPTAMDNPGAEKKP